MDILQPSRVAKCDSDNKRPARPHGELAMTNLTSAIEAKLSSVGPLADAASYAVAVINEAVCQHNHGKEKVASSEIAAALKKYAAGYSLWVTKPGAFEAPCRIVSIGHPSGYSHLVPFAG